MNGYFKLAAQFQTQDEPSYCGLSTLVMVLNTLGVDPGRVWKGPWRWCVVCVCVGGGPVLTGA